MLTVHFVKWDTKKSMLKKCLKLYEAAGTLDVIEKGDLVAIKLHVGEYGNPNHIKPIYIKELVAEIVARGGRPFITDSNTLYSVKRHNAVVHEHTAWAHGFAGIAPFVVADGLRGENGKMVPTRGILSEIEVAGAIAEADAMIVMTHAKGHGAAGVGAAIKNLGMGCTTPKGKKAQHSSVGLEIYEENCQGCGNCIEECFMDAISLRDDKVHIDMDLCMCCGACVDECVNGTLKLGNKDILCQALASATYGVLSTFAPGKVSFVSFATNISEYCDCASNPGPIVHPDVGVFASDSIVSIDSAVMNVFGKKLGEMHEIDPFIQTRTLKEFGVEGEIDPEIVDLQ